MNKIINIKNGGRLLQGGAYGGLIASGVQLLQDIYPDWPPSAFIFISTALFALVAAIIGTGVDFVKGDK